MKDRAFILGTGPSLNKIDVTKLSNEVTITFNRAYVAFEDWGFDPTYYLAIDGNDIRSLYKDINKLMRESDVEKFFLIQLTDNQKHEPRHFQDFEFKSNEEIYEKSEKLRLIQSIGSRVLPVLDDTVEIDNVIKTTIVPNAGFLGLKMLYHEGYRKIYLCGMDARYSNDDTYRDVEVDGGSYKAKEDNDKNHFRPDYFGKDIFFGKPNQDQIIRIWRDFIEKVKINYPDLEIISCSENSNLNSFIPYKEFESIL